MILNIYTNNIHFFYDLREIRQIVGSLFIPSVWLKKMFPLATLKHRGPLILFYFIFLLTQQRKKKSQMKTLMWVTQPEYLAISLYLFFLFSLYILGLKELFPFSYSSSHIIVLHFLTIGMSTTYLPAITTPDRLTEERKKTSFKC